MVGLGNIFWLNDFLDLTIGIEISKHSSTNEALGRMKDFNALYIIEDQLIPSAEIILFSSNCCTIHFTIKQFTQIAMP